MTELIPCQTDSAATQDWINQETHLWDLLSDEAFITASDQYLSPQVTAGIPNGSTR